MKTLEDRKKQIFERVTQSCQTANRSQDEVTVIAVTKSVSSDVALDLVDLGVKHLGENRVDKMIEKQEALSDYDITWHLIGNLQRRKVKDIINRIDYFHALDSLKLAQEIQKRAVQVVNCFLQVNISGEVSKHGFSPAEVDGIIEELMPLDNIRLVGVMTMAPLDATEDELVDIFKKTNDLRQYLASKQIEHMPFTELSMGMSGDFELAISQGATFVRIGTAFFEGVED